MQFGNLFVFYRYSRTATWWLLQRRPKHAGD